MTRSLLLVSSISLLVLSAAAQVPKKRLPQNINVPIYSHVFPSLSGDGNQMIYLTNYTNSEGFETKYTYRTGLERWADPEPIPDINRPGLDHIGSFCLSHDGNSVVFSSRRSPTIGNYDIWISEKKGSRWSAPQNPGKPLNSILNEGNPSLSPDGKSLYFMRCDQMDNTTKNNCALYVSHKISSTRWSEPERLPESINASHETTPRILADNQTLIFASGRPGGKGKLDVYSSRLSSGSWSHPKPLSFLNTAENDEYVSIPARGDIIYFSGPYKDQYNVFKAVIPEEFRPQKVVMLTGIVAYSDGDSPSVDAIVQVFDVVTGNLFMSTPLRDDDDGFTLFLPEGTAYDVSVFPQKGGHSYFSAIYDLSSIPHSRKEEVEISLQPIRPGISIPLTTIRYNSYTDILKSESDIEVKRIIGFLRKNQGFKVEIAAYIDKVHTDSIRTPELTEVIADTAYARLPAIDSVLVSGDTLLEASLDTTGWEMLVDSTSMHQTDSLISSGFLQIGQSEDSLYFQKITNTFHNDRTQKLANSLMEKLVEKGVPRDMLEAKGYGDNWSKDHAAEERNYWIELKILNY